MWNQYPSTFCFIILPVIMSRCKDETLGINFGNLIFSLPKKEKELIRKIEKLLYKINSTEAAIRFNEICLREGLLPK